MLKSDQCFSSLPYKISEFVFLFSHVKRLKEVFYKEKYLFQIFIKFSSRNIWILNDVLVFEIWHIWSKNGLETLKYFEKYQCNFIKKITNKLFHDSNKPLGNCNHSRLMRYTQTK